MPYLFFGNFANYAFYFAELKLLSSLLLCLIVTISLSTGVSADWTSVVLDWDETSVMSGSIGLSTSVEYDCYNYIDSTYDVYANVFYSEPGKSWQQTLSSLMNQDQAINGSLFHSISSNWELELNPWGWLYTECMASGNISF